MDVDLRNNKEEKPNKCSIYKIEKIYYLIDSKYTKEKKLYIKSSKIYVKNKSNSIYDKKSKNIFLKNESLIVTLLLLCIISILSQTINSKENIMKITSKSYNITVKIKQSGNHKIFFKGGIPDKCNNINYSPDIIINEITYLEPINNEYNFGQENNIIKLIWNNPIDSFACLFLDCYNITEIDLSEFDTSVIQIFEIMFANCNSLTTINFGNSKNTKAEYMGWMFSGCTSLKELNLSAFENSKFRSIGGMFNGCSSLISLDLSNIDTSLVEGMDFLFNECSSLTNLKLDNRFVTTSVKNMSYMFAGCSSLNYLDLSGFETSSTLDMGHMFEKCSSLSVLDLSSFNTLSVNNMEYMFNECSSLISLIIPNFKTEQVKSMKGMFQYCSSMEYCDLSHFKTEKLEDMSYMFLGCKKLSYINLSGLKTSSVTLMDRLFKGCSAIKTIDLSNFDTSKAYHIADMFYECSSLVSLDISKFNTSEAIHMDGIFGQCYSLISLNLSHFYTPKAQYMMWMFNDCYSLKYLDISNFNTENVEDLEGIFNNCNSLISLNISNFNTGKVKNMRNMFSSCYMLISLDLSHFNTQNVTDMSFMFNYCYNLKTLHIMNFDTSSVERMELMFYECKKLESLEISKFKTSKVKSMRAMFTRCLSVKSIDLSSFDTSSVTDFNYMFEECQFSSLNLSNFNTSNVETMYWMFMNSNKLTSLDLSSFEISKVTLMAQMIDGCNELKYVDLKRMKIEEYTSITQLIGKNIKNTVICMDDIQSFIKIITLYDWSYINCEGNWGEEKDKIDEEKNKCINNCLLSKYNSRCYQICSYYFYFDENQNQYICTEGPECPKTHNKLIHGKNECVKSCLDTKETKFEFNNNCLKECPENFKASEGSENSCIAACPKEKPFLLLDTLKCTANCTIIKRQNNLCIANYFPKGEDNFKILDKVIEQTRYELLNDFDPAIMNGKSINENGAKIIIKRTNEKNENDYEINLSECEEMLKETYNIAKNESLYLFRIDIEQEGMAVPSFEYELLYPIKSKNLEKLNLTICKDVKVKIDIPLNLTDDLEKYNSSSPYYNDICYIADSEDGADISLYDRKQDYVNNNMSICEKGCDFISYNTETQKAVCSCGIKIDIPFLDNVKIDKNLLLDSFTDINNIANTKMMTCYKTVFQKNLILKNMGCFIFGVLIFLILVCFLLFILKEYKKLVRKVKKVKSSILNEVRNENNLNKITKNKMKKKNVQDLSKEDIDSAKERQIKTDKTKIISRKRKKSKFKVSKNNFSPINRKLHIKEINTNNNSNKKLNINNKIDINSKNNNEYKIKNPKLLKKSLFKNKFPLKLTSSEINSYIYEEALIRDKRNFLEYYFSLLKINHLFLFVFNNEDYNSKMIKLSILFFNIATYIAVNSLFFNDSTMHKIYIDKGSYNFVFQLPQIIYSTLISAFLNGIIKRFGLSERNILNFKKMNIKLNDVKTLYKKLKLILRIKLALFYSCIFSLLFFYWYYVTCFCGIYRNTQLHLIKDSLCSFSTSLITPFGIYLLPAFFRIQSLKKNRKRCIDYLKFYRFYKYNILYYLS